MIIESAKLVQVLISSFDPVLQQPMQKSVDEIEGNAQDIAIVSMKGTGGYGYSLTEILTYLFEKARIE